MRIRSGQSLTKSLKVVSPGEWGGRGADDTEMNIFLAFLNELIFVYLYIYIEGTSWEACGGLSMTAFLNDWDGMGWVTAFGI